MLSLLEVDLWALAKISCTSRFEAGAFYVMDRGYPDSSRLCTLHQSNAFFVTRAKCGMNARRAYWMNVDRSPALSAAINASCSMASTYRRTIPSNWGASTSKTRKPARRCLDFRIVQCNYPTKFVQFLNRTLRMRKMSQYQLLEYRQFSMKEMFGARYKNDGLWCRRSPCQHIIG